MAESPAAGNAVCPSDAGDDATAASAIQYLTPADKLAERAEAILAARDAKLAAARQARKVRRQQERIPA